MFLDISYLLNSFKQDKTVGRRFVGERASDVQWKSMSNGFDVTSISFGHQLRFTDKSSHNRYCLIDLYVLYFFLLDSLQGFFERINLINLEETTRMILCQNISPHAFLVNHLLKAVV